MSGLILLFERPIKIGDVIEVGGNVGEVSRIGIRASVIRTADGSEVIVPNGSFISSQVTNWTFSDRQRAVEVSINVAGGADPQRVVELLKSTAAAHPGVTKEPSPQVYVTNFSAGAVTFQLRAWTDRHENWAQLADRTSEALDAINEAKALSERFEERWWYAELHRLRGVFLTALGADEAQIEASFCAAIRTAKEQKSISLKKRAEATYAEYRRQKASASGGLGFRLPLC